MWNPLIPQNFETGTILMAEKKRRRILAVDDENDILLILRTSLKEEYDVDTAASGPDALSLLEDVTPDLVILDLMMPEMDGLEVLDRIRERKETAATPVIFLTGVSDKEKIRAALDKGSSYYIVKPFNHNDLLSKVSIALKESDRTTTP